MNHGNERSGTIVMAVNMTQLEALILGKTRHLVVTGDPGDGSVAARQLDAVLMCAGFKCSRDLLERLSQTEPGRVVEVLRPLPAHL